MQVLFLSICIQGHTCSPFFTVSTLHFHLPHFISLINDPGAPHKSISHHIHACLEHEIKRMHTLYIANDRPKAQKRYYGSISFIIKKVKTQSSKLKTRAKTKGNTQNKVCKASYLFINNNFNTFIFLYNKIITIPTLCETGFSKLSQIQTNLKQV